MSGLDRVDLLPVGRGFFEATLTAATAGVTAQIEAGHRLTEDVSLVAFVRASSTWRGEYFATIGAGARW